MQRQFYGFGRSKRPLSATSAPFYDRFKALVPARSAFCLGLDPTPALLAAFGLQDDVSGLKAFCEIVLEASEDTLALVKPQSAYFERFGPEGLMVLRDVIATFQSRGTLVLLDVKRGDIGSTLSAYAQACIGPQSAFGADAMTATAYLGFDALEPVFAHASQTGSGVFVVVASSNAEGRQLQDARLKDGRSVAESLADDIRLLNTKQDDVKLAHAVVGATRDDLSEAFFQRFGGALILAPGIGAQGASLDNLPPALMSVRHTLIPTSARGVLQHGPDKTNLKTAITQHCETARALSD